MSSPLFSVVIVNYNGGDYPARALASLAAQTVVDFEVFLVDNASTDGSMASVYATYAPSADPSQSVDTVLAADADRDLAIMLHLRPQSANLGFAAGNNLAAREAKGQWLVLLNPDAEAAPNWLQQLVAATRRHPGVKMFASAQFDLHDSTRLDGAGDAYFGFGIPWRGGFGCPANDLPGEGTCFSPCGASAMFDRQLFLAHDGFDERFFCFCEDVDLGFRLRLAGESCVFVPDAVVDHAGGGLSGRTSDFAMYHGARNRLWTYLKNMPLRLLLVTLPIHILLMLAILWRNRKQPHVLSTLRGLRDGVRGVGPILASRRVLKQTRRARVGDIAHAMCWNLNTMRKRKPHIQKITDETRP